MLRLYQDDIIGIGCSDINPHDETLFAYKVCIMKISNPAEVMNTSDLSSTVLISDKMESRGQSDSHVVNVGEKRGISASNCDVPVPCKISKYMDNNGNNNSGVNPSEEINSNSLPGPSANVSRDNDNNSNANNIGTISDTAVCIKEEDDVEIIHTTFPVKDNWDIENCIDKYSTYLNNNKLEGQTDEKMDIYIDKDNSNGGKAIKEVYLKKEQSDKTNDTLYLKGSKFVYNNGQLIKYEEELQLTDEDEKAHLAVIDSKTTCTTTPIKLKKIKHEPKTRFSEIDIVNLSDDEEGVFPYSQLFDIKFQDNVKLEMEVKQEYVNNDIMKVEPLDIDDDVIIVTDSEDDDNRWLQRLSRSQLMNEDKEFNTTESVVKDEIDLGIWQEDDVLKIVQDEQPSTSKDINKMSEQSVNIGVSEDKETILEHTSTDKKIERGDNSDMNLSATNASTMDVGDVGLSNEPSSGTIDHTAKQKTDVTQQNAELRQQAETSSIISPPASAKYRSRFPTTKKVIPVIEAPHLPSRRGRPKSRDRKDDSKKDFSKDRSKATGTSEKSPPGSTTEENKMQKLKEKLDGHFYNKESKHSKETTSKRLPDHAIPSTSSNQASISKEEKKIILEERKARLKKLAEDEKLSADSNKGVKRGTAKPRVKISLKNRGDFLCNEQEAPVPKRSASRPTERAKSSNDKANRTSTCDANVPRSIAHGIETNKSDNEIISKNAVNNVTTSVEQSLCINDILDTIKLPEKYNKKKSNATNNTQEKQGSSKIRRKDTENTINTGEIAVSKLLERSSECASVSKQKSSLSSNLAGTKKKEKTVNFSTNVDIKEYEIESENTLKKLIGKDAPIPTDKLIKVEKTADATQWNSKYDEFLYRIFMWKPVWLEEQRYFTTSDPPIVPEEELQPMKVHYESFRHYYKIVTPLLLLEIWHSIRRDFETIEESAQRMTVMCSVVANTIKSKQIPTTDLFLTDMMLEVLVTKEEDVRSYPRVGDLVSVEYASHANDKQTFHKMFAYINNLYQTTITDFTRYNLQLRQYINNPSILITYTILTGPIQHNIHLNRVHRMRTIKYLRPEMKMVQAIQRLPQSPLVHLILNPKIQDYKLPPLNESFTCDSLVTKDRLNQKQLEAVSRVTDAVFKKEAKIALIQGPPGTGKTKVIVNLVTQILYGEYSERAEKNKILLCAPSNAAIDEIVTRLLVIRSQLKPKKRNKDRDTFNLVRIGVPEYMHPAAKTVSPSDLARRSLKRFTESVFCWSSNSTTDLRTEKMKLLKQIEEFERQRDDPNLIETKRSELKRDLTYATCKLELLQIGRLFDELDPKERNKYQRRAEDRILANADIIACTLSSCYTNQMESIFGINKERFSVCIVDEATQGREAETLIPLMLGVNTLVLVGDPNQLPATVLSQRAKKLRWDQSVFSRVQQAFESETNTPIIMLDTQYRMAYSISYWPNKYFYDSKLKNAAENKQTFPVHPYRVLSHNSAQNNDKFSNTTEAEFVSNIIHAILIYAKWESTNEPISIGILTPYNNQRSIVLQKIYEKISNLPDNMKKKIIYEVNTVDGFQGQERDIIIMSCVRSHGIGFLSDKQRLCVALTRARHSLILCGNFNTFLKDSMWNSLLSDARSRGVLCYVDAGVTSAIIKPYVVK